MYCVYSPVESFDFSGILIFSSHSVDLLDTTHAETDMTPSHGPTADTSIQAFKADDKQLCRCGPARTYINPPLQSSINSYALHLC